MDYREAGRRTLGGSLAAAGVTHDPILPENHAAIRSTSISTTRGRNERHIRLADHRSKSTFIVASRIRLELRFVSHRRDQ